MKHSANSRARSTPALFALAGLLLATGLGTLGGCAQPPGPYHSVLSGHPPLPPPATGLPPTEQRVYDEIDRQVLRDQDHRAAMEQPRGGYPPSPYFPLPLSFFGDFSNGRVPNWDGGRYGGSGWWR